MKRPLESSATDIDVTKCYARLSFWVSPDRIGEFEERYVERVAPILKKHDLVECSVGGRETVERVFSRLFEIETPGVVSAKERDLQNDSVWQDVVQDLEAKFESPRPEYLAFYGFQIFSSPADSGKEVSAGTGTGHWRNYDVTHGLWVTSMP